VNGGRAVCDGAGLASLLLDGDKGVQHFYLEAKAVQWVNQSLGTRHGPASPPIIHRASASSAGPSGVGHEVGTERSARGSAVVSAMGSDPSIGDPTRIYNTLVNSQAT
jgi:hypothetical protein